jgi:hypothetical protein
MLVSDSRAVASSSEDRQQEVHDMIPVNPEAGGYGSAALATPALIQAQKSKPAAATGSREHNTGFTPAGSCLPAARQVSPLKTQTKGRTGRRGRVPSGTTTHPKEFGFWGEAALARSPVHGNYYREMFFHIPFPSRTSSIHKADMKMQMLV